MPALAQGKVPGKPLSRENFNYKAVNKIHQKEDFPELYRKPNSPE
jgi:hypothetical protein